MGHNYFIFIILKIHSGNQQKITKNYFQNRSKQWSPTAKHGRKGRKSGTNRMRTHLDALDRHNNLRECTLWPNTRDAGISRMIFEGNCDEPRKLFLWGVLEDEWNDFCRTSHLCLSSSRQRLLLFMRGAEGIGWIGRRLALILLGGTSASLPISSWGG